MHQLFSLTKDTEEDASDERQEAATTCEDWKASTVGEKGYQSDDDGVTFRNAEGQVIDWSLEDGFKQSKCNSIAYVTTVGAVSFAVFATLAF